MKKALMLAIAVPLCVLLPKVAFGQSETPVTAMIGDSGMPPQVFIGTLVVTGGSIQFPAGIIGDCGAPSQSPTGVIGDFGGPSRYPAATITINGGSIHSPVGVIGDCGTPPVQPGGPPPPQQVIPGQARIDVTIYIPGANEQKPYEVKISAPTDIGASDRQLAISALEEVISKLKSLSH